LNEPLTVRQILDAGTRHLESKGVHDPKIACEMLMACLLKCGRMDLAMRLDLQPAPAQVEAMRRGVKRLATHEPVQYIIGSVPFMDHRFKVDSRALIPRPETELLVEQVLDCAVMRKESGRKVIVDFGTGSGCILISLALACPGNVYLGYDVSADALALARENAALLCPGVQLAFTSGDLADLLEPGTVSILAANLPYVKTGDYERLPDLIRKFEPRAALDGGPDGLQVITRAVEDAAILLQPGGMLFLEIGFDQGEPVRRLLEDTGFSEIRIVRDIAGHDRIVTSLLV
jgi:release factor glutamine methyltransferase